MNLQMFFEEREKPEKKNSRSKGENQQQTQPTCRRRQDLNPGPTLIGGECSNHCAIPYSPVEQGCKRGRPRHSWRRTRMLEL